MSLPHAHLFRLERDGHGPYRTGGYVHEIEKILTRIGGRDGDEAHPGVDVDIGGEKYEMGWLYDWLKPSHKAKFACDSLESLRAWFCAGTLEAFQALGYEVVEIIIPEAHIKRGKKQVVYDSSEVITSRRIRNDLNRPPNLPEADARERPRTLGQAWHQGQSGVYAEGDDGNRLAADGPLV